MTIDSFYDGILKLTPYTEDVTKPFYIRLKRCLRRYGDMVNKLEIDGVPVTPETRKEIMQICNVIYGIVKESMEGKPSKAFAQLNSLLVGGGGKKPNIDLDELVLRVEAGHHFYRVREMDNTYGAAREDLFHIPIPKRGMVKTHRYSSPGYPCLYLGESVYGCWEEMRRPPMHRCAVNRFSNDGELHLIDLRIPSKDKLRNESYLKLMPLVIACMMKVSDDNAIYKPEYIIPQFLIEWIIMYRMYNDGTGSYPIYGVAYHSTLLNEEFDFPLDKFVNYAIPVFKVDQNYKYCPALCDTFLLTEPTTNEREKLKGMYEIYLWKDDPDPDIRKRNNFVSSDFGQLEDRLRNQTKFPLEKINCKDGTD